MFVLTSWHMDQFPCLGNAVKQARYLGSQIRVSCILGSVVRQGYHLCSIDGESHCLGFLLG